MKTENDKKLLELYENPEIGISTNPRKFFETLRDDGYSFKQREVKEFLDKLPVTQIHNENKAVYLPIQVNNVRDQYQIDLIVLIKRKRRYTELDTVRKQDLRYIMTLIDVYSRKADCRYIENKNASTTLEALKSMIEDMGKPLEIQGDKGSEWGGQFKKYCDDNKIKLVLKDKDGKFSNGIIERFNRTLLGYYKRYRTEFPKQTLKQVAQKLPEFIDNYNNSIHRTIGIEPEFAFRDNMINLNRNGMTVREIELTNFKVGDYVRVRNEATIFTKGREDVYSKDVFKIIDKDANVYTISAPFNGRTKYSYNSLLKVELDSADLKKALKEKKKKTPKNVPTTIREPSARLARQERLKTLRKKNS